MSSKGGCIGLGNPIQPPEAYPTLVGDMNDYLITTFSVFDPRFIT